MHPSGYTPEIVKFRNGIMAVILCPTDDLDTAHSYMEELKNKGLYPADGWILTVNIEIMEKTI